MRTCICLIFFVQVGFAQKYMSSNSTVTFFSDAAIEDISAINHKGVAMFNASTNDIVFSIPIQEFQFEKSLMKEHFNEKYMESDQYPKATFEGDVIGFDPKIQTSQNVTAKGKLTIHGVSRDVDINGTISGDGNILNMKSTFIVKLQDHNISIPKLFWQKIAEQVEVKVDCAFKETK